MYLKLSIFLGFVWSSTFADAFSLIWESSRGCREATFLFHWQDLSDKNSDFVHPASCCVYFQIWAMLIIGPTIIIIGHLAISTLSNFINGIDRKQKCHEEKDE